MKVPFEHMDQSMFPVEKPAWAEEMLRELHAIKTLLTQQAQSKEDKRGLYDFINLFRKVMQADPQENSYPEVVLNGTRIGVTFAKLLYNKEDGKVFERSRAFEIYNALYREHLQKPLF